MLAGATPSPSGKAIQCDSTVLREQGSCEGGRAQTWRQLSFRLSREAGDCVDSPPSKEDVDLAVVSPPLLVGRDGGLISREQEIDRTARTESRISCGCRAASKVAILRSMILLDLGHWRGAYESEGVRGPVMMRNKTRRRTKTLLLFSLVFFSLYLPSLPVPAN